MQERVHVDSDPDDLTTVEELRYWGELQRQRAIDSYREERAAVQSRDSQAKIVDRFLTVLEQVTARR